MTCLLFFPTTGSLGTLLRELVSEFTLTDNLANTTTSLLRSMCHHDDSILHSSWLEETDHKDVEEQLQPNSAAGSGALEHDAASVFMTDTKVLSLSLSLSLSPFSFSLPPPSLIPLSLSLLSLPYFLSLLHNPPTHSPSLSQGTKLPGPLPLGVAVIDSAIVLFGKAFPAVAPKHRLQLLTHFRECIKQAKSSRQQAIQINIFTAFLSALKVCQRTRLHVHVVCAAIMHYHFLEM